VFLCVGKIVCFVGFVRGGALKLYVFLSGVWGCCIMFWDVEVVCCVLCESVSRMSCVVA